MAAHERAVVGQGHVEGRFAARIGFGEDRVEIVAQLGVEAVARRVDEGRHEPVERIAAQEERYALALLQPQDAERRLVELVDRALEQLLARIGLEDVLKRLGIVPVGSEIGLGDDGCDLVAQQRDLARALHIGGGREQPEEDLFADDRAGGGVDLDADRVEIGRPVHARSAVGFGDAQQVGGAHEMLQRCRQFGDAAQHVEHHEAVGARKSEAGARLHRTAEGSTLAVVFVFAISQKGEIVGCKPSQEIARGGDFGGLARRRGGGESFDDPAHVAQHRAPIRDAGAHVVEHVLDAVADRVELRLVALRVDFHMHEAFADTLFAEAEGSPARVARDRDDRVDHQMDGQFAPVDFRRDRIDEERHVVVDDLDDRMARVPAMLGQARIVDAYLGLGGPAHAPERPQGEC
jgi:hypothetical protein